MKLVQISFDFDLDEKRRKKCIKLGLIDPPKFGDWGLPPPLSCLILCLVIFYYWETWLKLVMLEHLQACFLLVLLQDAILKINDL